MDDAETLGNFMFTNNTCDSLSQRAQSSFGHLKHFAAFLLHCLWPSFSVPEKLNKVAYLDGLRGFAALLVYLDHNSGSAHIKNHQVLIDAFGADGQYYFAAFPILRLFFSGGSFAVAVFFIISGYVISLGPLKKLHGGQHTRLIADIGSAFPKRFVRIYIPVLCTTFCYMTIWHIFGLTSTLPENEEVMSYGNELMTWMNDLLTQTFYFFPGEGFREDRYNRHLWTLPMEIRGSYTVYATLLVSLAFHAWGTNARLWAQVALISYCIFLVDGWYLALFSMGMLFCDLDFLSTNQQLPKPLLRLKLLAKRGGGWIFYMSLIVAVLLAGTPGGTFKRFQEYGEPYHFLALLNPPASQKIRRFLLTWSAPLLMLSIPRIGWLKAFFELRPCQYLGKISYSLYLVHGPILSTFGYRLYAAVGIYDEEALERIPNWIDKLRLPNNGPVGLELNFVLAQLVLIPIVFYIAGVSTKLFDIPSVQIARQLCDPFRYSERRDDEIGGHEYQLIADSRDAQAPYDSVHHDIEMMENSLAVDSNHKPILSEGVFVKTSLDSPP